MIERRTSLPDDIEGERVIKVVEYTVEMKREDNMNSKHTGASERRYRYLDSMGDINL